MSSRSATRHIFLSKTIEQLKEERKKNLPMIFMDLEKAYKWYIEAVNLADIEEKREPCGVKSEFLVGDGMYKGSTSSPLGYDKLTVGDQDVSIMMQPPWLSKN